VTDVKAFVQARMRSTRFPGKVLAPLHGEPIVVHVVRAAGAAVGPDNVVVATSDEVSDDPLVEYLDSARISYFRGPLDDVLERFRLCAREHPSAWVVRLSADSPQLDPGVVRTVIEAASDDVDLVTTALGVSAHGTNAELVRTSALVGADTSDATDEEREHVMPFFYNRPDQFRILSVTVVSTAMTVDTVEDLARLEAS
jgi:spore coat polysaccharide biosynthesis protein SpsF